MENLGWKFANIAKVAWSHEWIYINWLTVVASCYYNLATKRCRINSTFHHWTMFRLWESSVFLKFRLQHRGKITKEALAVLCCPFLVVGSIKECLDVFTFAKNHPKCNHADCCTHVSYTNHTMVWDYWTSSLCSLLLFCPFPKIIENLFACLIVRPYFVAILLPSCGYYMLLTRIGLNGCNRWFFVINGIIGKIDCNTLHSRWDHSIRNCSECSIWPTMIYIVDTTCC